MLETRTAAEVEAEANERANELFEILVVKVLGGEIKKVLVREANPANANETSPKITIGGLTTRAYARDDMKDRTPKPDRSLVNATAETFGIKMASDWLPTMAYYAWLRDELEELAPEMSLLAMSCGPGYSELARKQFESQGIVDVGDGELMMSARELACQALIVWADAVARQPEQN